MATPHSHVAGNFWTSELKQTFHEHVTRLNRWNREPCPAEDYRRNRVQESDVYVLRIGEELHFADHIAFLAHNKEGAKYVAAVTIEEDREGQSLTIRVAANLTPSKNVLHSLSGIFQVLESYARKDMSREECRESLFERVILMSEERIITRIGSKRLPKPSWNGQIVRDPLHTRLRTKLAILKRKILKQSFGKDMLRSLEELATQFENVNASSLTDRKDLIKIAVRKSFAVSTMGNSVSLESHLRNMNVQKQIFESREIAEVDKISRYFGMCNDLTRFLRRPACRPLFSNIKLEHCNSPPPVRPTGSQDACHVHGEVQLVLHYEQYPTVPPPRAIGSSKSACFLCDLFIQKHNQFRISHSHKRLYHQWTIPDVQWMNTQQVIKFQNIVRAMTNELARLLKTTGKHLRADSNGFESRAHLLFPARPFTASSTPSVYSRPSTIAQDVLTPPQTPSSTSTKREPSLAESSFCRRLTIRDIDDLPYQRSINLVTPTLFLEIGKASYTFEFLGVQAGRIEIVRVESQAIQKSQLQSLVDVKDIPVEHDMRINCSKDESDLRLLLRSPRGDIICVAIQWEHDLISAI